MTDKHYLSKAFFVIAIISFVFAAMCFFMSSSLVYGDTESNLSYGGDAYTGIQNAAAQTATNTYYVNKSISALIECIKTISGYMFIVVGITFSSLSKAFSPAKKNAVVAATPVTPAPVTPATITDEENASKNILETKNII